MNFISLEIITEKSLEYECGITEYLPPLPLSALLITYSMFLILSVENVLLWLTSRGCWFHLNKFRLLTL